MFGLADDSASSGRSKVSDLMERDPLAITITTLSESNVRTKVTSIVTSTSSTNTSQFHPLPFNSTSNEVTTNDKRSFPYKEKTFPSSQSLSNSMLKNQSSTVLPGHTSVYPPQKSLANNRQANSASLDSLMIKNAGIQRSTGRLSNYAISFKFQRFCVYNTH